MAFVALATLNAGGYRFGASDQAFYIPAILHQLDPALFPRDWAMLGAQGRFFFVDEIFASLVRVSGWSLAAWFAVAQLATLAVLYAGALALGRQVLTSPWALTAWMAALTLRHRIAKTGANTLEGYFHPRMLVFGLGLVALADVLRGRRWRPVLLLLVGATLHPTTAALFLGLVLVALVVGDARLRLPLARRRRRGCPCRCGGARGRRYALRPHAHGRHLARARRHQGLHLPDGVVSSARGPRTWPGRSCCWRLAGCATATAR